MLRIGLTMLLADHVKSIVLIFGVSFAIFMASQNTSLFIGLLSRSQSVISDVEQADIWVMDPSVEYVDSPRPLRDVELQRVKGVAGVEWAVPFFRVTTQLRTREGRTVNATLIGVDDASMIGLRKGFILGSPDDLRLPDAIAVDYAGFNKIWPGETPDLGRVLELNDRRGVVTAISQASAPLVGTAVIYTRYSQALDYFPGAGNHLSFVLVRVEAGRDAAEVARAITARTGMKAYTSAEFSAVTMTFHFANTGILLNFAVVIGFGFIIGIAIVALTLNMFISDNIQQFATLKAMGASDALIVAMVLAQAAFVGAVGYCIGLGGAALFLAFQDFPTSDLRGFYIPWWVAAAVAAATVVVMAIASATSLRRVMVVDPAIVFRG